MAVVRSVVTFILILFNPINVFTNETIETDLQMPFKFNTVLISILVRNKEHTLPYFLTYLERLDYPKDRIALLFFSDHNIDRSIEVLKKWITVNIKNYHSIESVLDEESTRIPGEEGVAHWPRERYSHIMDLREEAISLARHKWADYIWVLDADVFITNPNTLHKLMLKRKIITAPMLRSDGLYSNFWCGMTPEFYYRRTEEYSQILGRKKKGCFSVPMVHSAVLIDLRAVMSDDLTYNPENLHEYSGPHDDIITFARSANISGVNMFVCNDETYGYVMVPMEKDDRLNYDLLQLKNLKLEVLVESGPLEYNVLLQEYVSIPEEDLIPVDETFMINLLRRPDRRKRMEASFAELRLDVTIVNAVDGQ
nr:glycosyltransferase 25 family member [Halyomorpha halys]